ncbi:hypothetical protein DK880_00878 [Candidatus Cardinium hertigii]|uniref:Uncharacterized protein n=1 Tax=Candidatus Cardinium hertigii TaxID=247481 RepID=A0A2Z3LA03_9BACT|nr:hypothetical protein DK880_00878 [Candidatus Cardinium hertigii]
MLAAHYLVVLELLCIYLLINYKNYNILYNNHIGKYIILVMIIFSLSHLVIFLIVNNRIEKAAAVEALKRTGQLKLLI